MTTTNPSITTTQVPDDFRFPDPPEREPDDMTSFDHLAANGNVYLLAHHLGNRGTTLVAGEHYISATPVQSMTDVRYPDLLVAFGVDPAAYYRRNGYIISEQGKPPDFVLEIASRATGRIDVLEKREDYAKLGIPEYWRFDETGQFHGTQLAGDRLVNEEYQPIVIEDLPGRIRRGYSAVLNLNLRWENGHLLWHDPATGQHIVTLDDERARANAEKTRANAEKTRANAAEARNQELEAELRRLRNS